MVSNRGAIRLEQFQWDAERLREEVEQVGEEDWGTLDYGEEWGRFQFLQPDGRGGATPHPVFEKCPYIQEIANSFGGKIQAITLASLGPGGWIKEHRDISGGLTMGVARFHVPVVTHRDVEFYADRERVRMGPGEVWLLDTTYLHRLKNDSDVNRLHLIFDIELNDEVRKLLPEPDLRYRVHQAHYAAICVGKGAKLLAKNPRGFVDRVEKFFRLLVLKQSQLTYDD